MGPVVGIDLGTTNTVVGVVRSGQAAALSDENGDKPLPSVVSFHPNGNVLVGRSAKERRLVDARNTVYSVKRLIGRAWDSEELRTARARFPFEMREGPGQAALVVARGETYTLPEISAFVLRKAKSMAETALGAQVSRAVVTVPANFNDLQRAATKVAGRVAGLEVLRILNEPTAAALAYGYGKNSSERIAVYDFGGGTFDVTLLDLSDNVFEVLATAGNTFLGGDDIDMAIAERMADEFLAQHRYDPRTDSQIYERLRVAAENVKVRLTSEPLVTINLQELAHGAGGKALSLQFTMNRTELERMASGIVDRTFDVCREAMGIARLRPEDFDQVLLVGGSTRIPLVRRRVEEFFKRQALGHISPDEVVAIGAAIQANALSGAERRKTDVPAPPRSRPTQSDVSHKAPPVPSRRPTGPNATQVMATATPPLARAPMPTSPGLDSLPGHEPQPVPPIVVPPPAGMPSRPAPETADQTGRQKQTTGLGLGSPPAAGGSLAPLAPNTTPGLGRGRARTGSGLGAIEQAHRPVTDPPKQPPLPLTPATTLASATDAAREARRRAEEAHLPLVGNLDEQTLKQSRDDITAPVSVPAPPPPLRRPPAPSAPSLNPEQIAAKYGGLPLTMPGQIPLPQRRLSEPPSSSRIPIAETVNEYDLPVPDLPPRESSRAPSRMPPSPALQQSAPPQQQAWAPSPLLVDVTPLTLSVETVSGYCDTIIERNTPVPCERTRPFVTALDNQTQVRVRVSQGESSRFAQNTLLGELELSGLRPAPRGDVTISVSFTLDTDGILNVSATDMQTGRATSARVHLVGLPDPGQVTEMAARQQAQPVS